MFEKTIAFAESIRFKGDVYSSGDYGCENMKEKLKSSLFRSELCVTEALTPRLFQSLVNVLKRLKIDSDKVLVFVYPSPDFNAECYANDFNDCIIRISSSLIEILSQEEFEFVIAHELGHFLLSHYSLGENDNSYEYSIIRRAQEISADRVGLMGAASLQVALKALLKTCSGLSDEYLKFDFGAFVRQLQSVSTGQYFSNNSTHPSIIIRCRALLWFSMSSIYNIENGSSDTNELVALDLKIQNDIDKYEDKVINTEIELSKSTLEMWMAAQLIVASGRLSKPHKEKFTERFGNDQLGKFLNFLDGYSKDEVIKHVDHKCKEARYELRSYIPRAYEKTLRDIEISLTEFRNHS